LRNGGRYFWKLRSTDVCRAFGGGGGRECAGGGGEGRGGGGEGEDLDKWMVSAPEH
jgi:hypothetical protein